MKRGLLVAVTTVAALAAAAPAQAQGSSVMTHGSCATAMGAAGVARPCQDGSAILFNPAALAMQPSVVGVGVSGITSSGSFTYDFTGERVERDETTTPVPFGYASFRFRDRFAAGIGAFAPYGLGIQWPEDFEGRFASFDTELRNIYIQPTLSFAVTPRIAVGAGVDFVLASIDINQAVDLSTLRVPGQTFNFEAFGIPRGTDFARANLSGSGTGVTFNLGAKAQITDAISLGVRYLHSAEIDYDGDADFEAVSTGLIIPGGVGNPLNPTPNPLPVDAIVAGQFAAGGALADQGLSTSLTLPSQFVVGVAVRPVPAFTLLADYQYTGWDSFGVARIDFADAGPDSDLVLDYQNTSTYRIGGEFSASELFTLRGGFIYNTAAEKDASVSPLLPEAERNYYSVGLGLRPFGNLGVDVGYQYVDQSDRRGRVRGRASLSETAEQLNVGVYSADASILSVTLSYHFGGMR